MLICGDTVLVDMVGFIYHYAMRHNLTTVFKATNTTGDADAYLDCYISNPANTRISE